MERDVMLTGGSTAARGEGEEAEGNVLPVLSTINSHCLWTKKICRIWQCGLFKTARLPRSWLHVLRGRGIARICDRICREDRSLRKRPHSQARTPARARRRGGSACRALRRWRGKFSRQRSNYSSSWFRRHTLDCAHTLCIPNYPKLTRKILSSTNSRTNSSLSSFRRTSVGSARACTHTLCLATSKADKEKN
jgi:hypothetical protein